TRLAVDAMGRCIWRRCFATDRERALDARAARHSVEEQYDDTGRGAGIRKHRATQRCRACGSASRFRRGRMVGSGRGGLPAGAIAGRGARLARVRENLARLKLDAEFVESDLRDFKPEAPAPFVLLDAPCSATGTIR